MIVTSSLYRLSQRCCTLAMLGLIVLCLWASPILAEGIQLDASRRQSSIVAKTDRSRIALSDELPLTLTIEGPAPIKVTLLKSILDSDSAPFWRIKGNSPPVTEPLPEGQERWKQVFRLSPFEAGKQIPLSLAHFELQVGTLPALAVKWPKSATIEVTTSISSPEKEALRPVTEIESLPPTAPQSQHDFRIAVTLVMVGVVLGLLIARVLRRWRRSRVEGQIHNAEWALAELKKMPLLASVGDARRHLPQLADILRRFLEYRFQLPALRRTTPELLEQLHQVDPNIDWKKLGQVLYACDRAKFADDFSDGPEFTLYADLHEWAIQFITSLMPEMSVRPTTDQSR